MGGCASSSSSLDAVVTKTRDGRWVRKDKPQHKQTEPLKKPRGPQPIQSAKTSLRSPLNCSNTTRPKTMTTESSWDTSTLSSMTIPLLIDYSDSTATTISTRKQRIDSYLAKAPDCSFYSSTKAAPPDYISESAKRELISNYNCNLKKAPATKCADPRSRTSHQQFQFDGAYTWTYDGGSQVYFIEDSNVGRKQGGIDSGGICNGYSDYYGGGFENSVSCGGYDSGFGYGDASCGCGGDSGGSGGDSGGSGGDSGGCGGGGGCGD